MNILVLNCGSSSVKFQLIDSETGHYKAKGLCERIGSEDAISNYQIAGQDKIKETMPMQNHKVAIQKIIDNLLHANHGIIKSKDEIHAIGHRMVHGAEIFTHPVLIDAAVIEQTRKCCKLAPLHNPANLIGIESALEILPGIPQCGIYDTAFHQTMPRHAYLYAIPMSLYKKHGIRRYGFHGTSHAYVSRRVADLLDRPYDELNTITLHLGNGASACAVQGGRSVATSMGMSPLEGLVMGTRSGDLDPTVIFHLRREGGMVVDDIDDLLNHRSGLLGLTGVNDMREVLARRDAGDPDATLAFDVYCRRITGYVGAYYALLGRVDAIAFTAGVGEHAAPVRAASLAGLERLGVTVDPARNDGHGDRVVSPDGAEVAVLVVGTDEEREIARETREVLGV